ncbi:MAG: hypothetical protein J6V92_07530 [Bacteroidaceae bacterium]|nr:hypothetical protein [Bacteroidaceae bacterium]
MNHRLFLSIVILALSGSTFAQTQNLAGRTYYNANIMSGKMNDVISKAIPEAKAEKIAEIEKEKGRKLTDAEKAEVEKELQEAQTKANSVIKGIKTEATIEFKTEKDAVMKFDMQVDEEVLKQNGIGWAKRKALKAVIALAPTTEKATYMVKGNLVILDPNDEPDTLRLSDDGKYLYGKFDEKTNYKLTRTK